LVVPRRHDQVGGYPRPHERPPPLCGGSLEELAALGVHFFGEWCAAIAAL